MPVKVKTADYFAVISLTKAIFQYISMESRSSELYLQLSFKYYSNSCFIQKLFLKVWQILVTRQVDL